MQTNNNETYAYTHSNSSQKTKQNKRKRTNADWTLKICELKIFAACFFRIFFVRYSIKNPCMHNFNGSTFQSGVEKNLQSFYAYVPIPQSMSDSHTQKLCHICTLPISLLLHTLSAGLALNKHSLTPQSPKNVGTLCLYTHCSVRNSTVNKSN